MQIPQPYSFRHDQSTFIKDEFSSRLNLRMHAKEMLLSGLLISLTTPMAFGGQVYGQITKNEQAVENEGPITLICHGNTSQEAMTDRFGGYKVYLDETGECEIRLEYDNKTLKYEDVNSYDDPVRYNLEIIRDSDGNLDLRRK